MKTIDWSRSDKLASTVDARIGACVANVVMAFLDFRNALPEDAVYVEGLWKIGGQVACHTWIETNDTIIDPTLACETNHHLRQSAKHYPIETYTEDQVRNRFGNQPCGPGNRLEMDLGWDDPRVQNLADEIDLPGFERP